MSAPLSLKASELLRSLPGIVAVCPLERAALAALAEIERHYEQSALLPLVNLGLPAVMARQAALAILKDRHFRQPPAATVYLVEEAADWQTGPAHHFLEVDGRRFHVVGEEVLDPARAYGEPVVAVSGSFVLFPDRRTGKTVPSCFLLPPLPFPELEERGERLGIERIVSISPSSLADEFLREACGFPRDDSLATLLVGFDAPRPGKAAAGG